MNRIAIVLLVSIAAFVAKAQDNDTSLIRTLKVAEVHKKLYVHAFESKKDSCLYTHRKFNKGGKLTYEKTDMTCMGWPSYEEMFFSYNGDLVNKININRDNSRQNSYKTYLKTPKKSHSFLPTRFLCAICTWLTVMNIMHIISQTDHLISSKRGASDIGPS